MGTVWLAERADGLHRRQVALKLPHGAWLRPGLLERLAREREILAALEHPHIARLYDAGISQDDAQPWLAIEYVDGVRLDEHCRAQQLDVPQRIALFLQVCDAVAHAHSRLVVHRDLKPANILIDRAGQVRLLDFGIARLVEDDGELTQQLGAAATPDYAAPEQLLGLPLGTAVDVYGLGVVLFELLTGQRPQCRTTTGVTAQAALAKEADAPPPRPSDHATDPALARRLRGDLDTIVTKALQWSPADRYATVAALAEDLRRHLADEAILARPEGTWARVRRAARRYRGTVIATGLVLVTLVSGAGLALWQAQHARQQRDLALAAHAEAAREAEAARGAERVAAAESDLSSFLLADLTSRSPDTDMAHQLERATTMVRAQYRDQPSVLGRMLVNLALNYRWISLHEQAERLFAEAEPLLRKHGPPPLLAHWLCLQAPRFARDGDHDTARAHLTQAYALLDGRSDAAVTRGDCLMEDALVLRYRGETARAAEAGEQALREFERAGRGQGEQASEALNVIARARGEAAQYAAAVKAAQASVALLERTGRDATPGYRNAWGLLARGLRDGGQPLQALPAHGGNGRFDAADPSMPTPVRLDLAETLIQLHRFDAAESVLVGALTTARADHDANQVLFIQLARLQLATASGRTAGAERLRAEVERGAAPWRAQHRARARRALLVLAEHALARQRPDEAEGLLAELDALVPAQAVRTPDIQQERHRLQAGIAQGRGQADVALRELDAALVLAELTAVDPKASVAVARLHLARAQLLDTQGHSPQARSARQLASEHLRAAGGPAHPLLAAARP